MAQRDVVKGQGQAGCAFTAGGRREGTAAGDEFCAVGGAGQHQLAAHDCGVNELAALTVDLGGQVTQNCIDVRAGGQGLVIELGHCDRTGAGVDRGRGQENLVSDAGVDGGAQAQLVDLLEAR